MKRKILGYIKKLDRKTFNTGKLHKYIQTSYNNLYKDNEEYIGFYNTVTGLVNEGLISPVKASGRYFMTPPLYNRYRILGSNSLDETGTRSEIMSLNTGLDKNYYLKHIDKYKSDRKHIILLNNWINKPESSKLLKERLTVNERSFQIYNDEKYLSKRGQSVLSNLGMCLDDLNCYKTYEAFFYILLGKRQRGNVLVVENKDSFMSLMYYCQKLKYPQVLGVPISMLVYGEGKKIIKSFEFMKELQRRYKPLKIYYWGDLDNTGIEIFLKFKNKYNDYDIIPHNGLYLRMINNTSNPPELRTSQNKTAISDFICHFDMDTGQKIKRIIDKGRYIPQEAVRFEQF